MRGGRGGRLGQRVAHSARVAGDNFAQPREIPRSPPSRRRYAPQAISVDLASWGTGNWHRVKFKDNKGGGGGGGRGAHKDFLDPSVKRTGRGPMRGGREASGQKRRYPQRFQHAHKPPDKHGGGGQDKGGRKAMHQARVSGQAAGGSHALTKSPVRRPRKGGAAAAAGAGGGGVGGGVNSYFGGDNSRTGRRNRPPGLGPKAAAAAGRQNRF